jgi:hypothetical protein
MFNFTYNWRNTFTVYVPDLIPVEFLLLIEPQFARNAQNVLCLAQCTHGYVWSCNVAPLQMFRGACEWFDRQQKCLGEVSFHFQFELNTLGFLSVSTNTNLKDWVRTNARFVPRNRCVCGHGLVWNFPVFFLWGTHSQNFSKHIDSPVDMCFHWRQEDKIF